MFVQHQPVKRRIETTINAKDKTEATHLAVKALENGAGTVIVQHLPGLNPEWPYEVRTTIEETA